MKKVGRIRDALCLVLPSNGCVQLVTATRMLSRQLSVIGRLITFSQASIQAQRRARMTAAGFYGRWNYARVLLKKSLKASKSFQAQLVVVETLSYCYPGGKHSPRTSYWSRSQVSYGVGCCR